MDVETMFLAVGALATAVGAFLRFDNYSTHDVVGKLAEGFGFVEMAVVGAIDQQRDAKKQVECSIEGRCEGMPTPDNVVELFSPLAIGAVRGVVLAGIAVGMGWAAAQLTARRPTRSR